MFVREYVIKQITASNLHDQTHFIFIYNVWYSMLANLLRSQGVEMSGYCPQWIYSTCIGLVLKDFLEKDIPLDMLSRKYGKELAEKYNEINPIQMAVIAEDIIRILAEIEAGSDAVKYINGYIYFTVNFEAIGKKRSRKLLLGSIFDSERVLRYDEKTIVRSFKAYMYSLRSGATPSAPSGWSLDQEKDIDFLKDISLKEMSIFDAVQF